MKARVLAVDDEQGFRDMLHWELTRQGYFVEVAENGLQAVQKLSSGQFDVVVSDIRMPGMSGIDVLHRVKEVAANTAVIISTGYANVESAIECLRGGAFDILEKPCQMPALVSTVERALERQRLTAAASLFKACEVIFTGADDQSLSDRIVDVSMQVMGADDVSLMLLNEHGQLFVAHATGLSPTEREQALVPLGQQVAGKVLLERVPVLINGSIAEDPRFTGLKGYRRIRSSIIYPLYGHDRPVGVINFNRIQLDKPFVKEDIDRASVLASQALLAIENQRLVRHTVAAERMASIGQVSASVAHEINNPLTYLLSSQLFMRDRLSEMVPFAKAIDEERFNEAFLEWGKMGGFDLWKELIEASDDSLEGANRIRDIARDLRSMARSGDDANESQVFNLNESVQCAARVSGADLRRSANLQVDACEPVFVKAVPGRITQVILNLLVNACQAMSNRARELNKLRVATRFDEMSVTIDVIDNGPGIRPEHVPRLFENFFTTKPAGEGTGLGLWISRDIVRRAGGTIEVKTEVGVGTTFSVTLPRVQKPNESRD